MWTLKDCIDDVTLRALQDTFSAAAGCPVSICGSKGQPLVIPVLDDDDNPISWVLHEYEETDRGTRMRSTFILPAEAPTPFIEGLRKHNEEEMGRLPVFLPGLYRSQGEE